MSVFVTIYIPVMCSSYWEFNLLFWLYQRQICPCACIPHYEDVWGTGRNTPHILKLNAKWRWLVNFNFTLWLLL